MAWANFSVFAIGSLLMGIPLLLHLLMKKRPRHQVFPALRFLQQRQVVNKRQMQLRNWLLLALRMAAIGLLATLFARPTVDSAAMGYWLRALLLGVLAPLAIVVFLYSLLQRKSHLISGFAGVASLLLLMGLAYFSYRGLTTGKNGNLGDANDPVAAVLVFDTSPRMGLRHENKTRLDEAQEMAVQLMKQLPPDSEVAVLDGANMGAFSVDIGVAATSVDALNVLDFEFPLTELIQRGLELVSDRNDKRKEVYVFSEMSGHVWQQRAFQPIRKRLEQETDISLFVLDLGVEKPRNVRLGQLSLSGDSLASGQPLELESEIISLNVDGDVDVEIALEEPDPTRPVMVDGKLLVPELTTRKRRTYQIQSGSNLPVAFPPLIGLQPGVHHGQVRLRSSDGLSVDDVRYFTVAVRPPFPVLLVKFDGADPAPVKQAISPDQFELEGQSAYECHIIEPNQLLGQLPGPTDLAASRGNTSASAVRSQPNGQRTLADFSVVALLDPNSMTKPHWDELERFVRSGGSLVLFLGTNVTPVDEFRQAANVLLPGDIRRIWRTAPNNWLLVSLENTAHPILAKFRGYEDLVEWDKSPIYKHWMFDDLSPGANVVARFSNNQPMLVESTLGDGRIVAMTTPVSDATNNGNREQWNELITTDVPLPFFMLTTGLFQHLAQHSQQSWNHGVGQTVSVSTQRIDPSQPSADTGTAWQLVSPQGDWQNVRGENGEVTIVATEQVGTYRLKPTDPTKLGIGFSTNLPTQATDLSRLDTSKLDDLLGENTYTLARGTDELNRGIGRARVGRELFPFLILIVVGLLAMEHLLSNRFYSNQSSNQSPSKMKRAA